MRLQTNNRRYLIRLIVVQILVSVVLAAIALLQDKVMFYSIIIGSMTFFIPNLYFIWKTFRYQGARSAGKIIRSFYAGESMKLILIATLFGLAFALVKPINVLAVFIGFIALQLTSWLTPWLALKK